MRQVSYVDHAHLDDDAIERLAECATLAAPPEPASSTSPTDEAEFFCTVGVRCASTYGALLTGAEADIAAACAREPACVAYQHQYNAQQRYGFRCAESATRADPDVRVCSRTPDPTACNYEPPKVTLTADVDAVIRINDTAVVFSFSSHVALEVHVDRRRPPRPPDGRRHSPASFPLLPHFPVRPTCLWTVPQPTALPQRSLSPSPHSRVHTHTVQHFHSPTSLRNQRERLSFRRRCACGMARRR